MSQTLHEAVQTVYEHALTRSVNRRNPPEPHAQALLIQLVDTLEALWPARCREYREAVAYRCAREYRAQN